MKIGIVGYGTGGQHFHAPLHRRDRGLRAGGCGGTRAGHAGRKVEADLPVMPIFPCLNEVRDAGESAETGLTITP